jgi:hypothetical protein
MTTNQSEKINIMHTCPARTTPTREIERPAVRAHIQIAQPLANFAPVQEHLTKNLCLQKKSLFFV